MANNKTALAYRNGKEIADGPCKASAFMTRGLTRDSVNWDLQMGTQLKRFAEGEEDNEREEVFLPDCYKDRNLYKCSSDVEPKHHHYSVLELRNLDLSCRRYMQERCKQFDKMYAKRAYVNWSIGNGLE